MFILSNGQKVVCKVISLEKDQERRKLFFAQEGAEFFDYFKAATPELNRTLKIFNEDAFASLNVDSPKPGEIGCMLSHYLVLKEFLENENADSSFILVAEDDAIFDKKLFQVVENVAKILEEGEVGILGLAHTTEPGFYDFFGSDENLVQISLLSSVVGEGKNRKYRFGKPVGLVMGAGLYIMTRSAALNYLNYIQRVGNIHWAADQWGYFEKPASLNIKVLQPSACGFRKVSSIREIPPSSIGDGDYGKKRGIRGQSRGKIQDLRSYMALRTRMRRIRGVLSATFLDLSDKFSPKLF